MRKNYPSDVKNLRVVSLQMPQLKIMLEFLGVSLARQPKTKADKVSMLIQRIEAAPEEAQQAYDVVVLNKLPEPPKVEDVEKLRSQYLGTMSQLMGETQIAQLEGSVEPIVEKAEKRIEQMVAKAVAKAAESYRPFAIKSGRTVKKVSGILPEEFPTLVQLASQRVPIYMVGPAGCGKTYIAEKVAEALGLKFADQSCSEGISESVFTGWLLPTKSGGAFGHVTTPFLECYEKGGVFLFDEIDNSDSNLLTFLNKAIANDSFYLPQRYNKPLVKKHKDFVVIAAANTFGHGGDAQYVGRNALDAATLDRFRTGMIHMDYSDTVETALINPEVLSWGRSVRRCIRRNKLRKIMSTRVLINLSKMTENCGWTVEDWEKSYFSDWHESELSHWKNGGTANAN